MKQLWSPSWKSSKQPRKQRKFRHNAPLHVMHKLVSANLSPVLRNEFGKRSMPLRKGDEVEVMRGGFKKLKGLVDRIDVKKGKIYVENIKIKKVDGSEVLRALEPSNLRITKLGLDDKKRQKVVERAPGRKKKPEKKPEKKEAKKETVKKEEPKAPEKPAKEKEKPAEEKKEEKPAEKPEEKETKKEKENVK